MKPTELLAKVFGATLGALGVLIVYGSLTTGGEAAPFLALGASLIVLGIILAFLPRK